MKHVALSEVKDDLSKYLRLAEKEEVIITRHGKPAGILIGFESEDEWFEYRLEHDATFLQRVEHARQSLRCYHCWLGIIRDHPAVRNGRSIG